MALITIPPIPEKGVPQTYTLNVTDLIALISDTYFQQQTNWSKVVVMYQSSVSNQIEGITFTPDGVSTSLEADGTFSLEARDIFNVQSITVVDKQNGRNIIYAASIPDVANYEVDFSVAPPPLGFTWGQIGAGVFENTPTMVHLVSGGSGAYNSGAYSIETLALTSDGSVTFTYDFFPEGSNYGPIGFSDSTGGGAAPIDYGIFATGTSIQIALNNTWGEPQPNVMPLTQPAVYGITTFKVAIETGNFVLYQDGIKRDERPISSVPSATGPMRFWMNFAGEVNQIVTVVAQEGF